ncbi:unnamed protein product [Meganyctiphanes norvegica]|uniref:Protein YIPF n=1 Tax=Meganyctiphanes norvegica TaxID=48144 RepID=A0AAV2RBV9_MEGNR
MASKDFAVLDLQNDNDELNMDLQFQDFGSAQTKPTGGKHEQTIHFTDFPDSAEDEHDKLLNEEGEESGAASQVTTGSFWSFEYYQQFFNVDSKQVGDRIIWSMVPKPGVSYLQTYIRPNPDLYGPFWICLTLVFSTAITGNLANYFHMVGENTWRYDFHKVTFAATAIFLYAWLVPLAVWGALKWRGSSANISLLELICIYGYSLSIFIPVSIIWMFPQPWLQWCVAIVAPVLSGSVLVRTVWPALSHDAKQVALAIAVLILVLHTTLALGFMLYFFKAPAASNKLPANVPPSQLVPGSAAAAAIVPNVSSPPKVDGAGPAAVDAKRESKPDMDENNNKVEKEQVEKNEKKEDKSPLEEVKDEKDKNAKVEEKSEKLAPDEKKV